MDVDDLVVLDGEVVPCGLQVGGLHEEAGGDGLADVGVIPGAAERCARLVQLHGHRTHCDTVVHNWVITGRLRSGHGTSAAVASILWPHQSRHLRLMTIMIASSQSEGANMNRAGLQMPGRRG